MGQNNLKYYAGIGSRETPPNILNLMTDISLFLDKEKYILRSGGANGADSAFEKGANNKQIFLPWKGFNNNPSLLFQMPIKAEEIAKEFHPYYNSLSQGAKKLQTRNVLQILGENLDKPVEFVICWTKNGKEQGGTGQAIRIAKEYNVKIYNLYFEKDTDYWIKKIT